MPRVSSYEVISHGLFFHLDTRKCELIYSETNCWKKEVIRQIFLLLDVEAILSIPLSARLSVDRLIWAESNNGSFSVRSAYKVAMNLHRSPNAGSSSTDSSLREIWKKFWHLPTPHKFVILRGGLAMTSFLLRIICNSVRCFQKTCVMSVVLQ